MRTGGPSAHGMGCTAWFDGGWVLVVDEATGELRPMELYPFERQIAEWIDELDPITQLRKYQTGGVSTIKKAGKSSFLAGAANWGMVADPHAREREVIIVGPDLSQGKDIVFGLACKQIQRHEWLAKHCVIRSNEVVYTQRTRDPKTGGIITMSNIMRVVSSDARSLHGYNPSLTIVDEAWVWENYETLEALAPSPARRCPLTLFASYAGLNSQKRKGVPWWDLTQQAKARTNPKLFWAELSGPNAWKQVPWIDSSWIELMRQQYEACPSKFRRLCFNEWSSGDHGLVSADELAAALSIDTPAPEYGDAAADYYCGLDIGLKNDWTGLSLVHMDDLGHAVVDVVKYWRGTSTEPVRISDVEAEIDRLRSRFNIRRFTIDAWQGAQLCERLRDHGAAADGVQLTAGIVDTQITKLKSLFSSRSIHLNRRHVELIEQIESLKVIEGRRRDMLKFSASGTGSSAAVHDDLAWAVMLALMPIIDTVGKLVLPVQTRCPRPELPACFLFSRNYWGGGRQRLPGRVSVVPGRAGPMGGCRLSRRRRTNVVPPSGQRRDQPDGQPGSVEQVQFVADDWIVTRGRADGCRGGPDLTRSEQLNMFRR